MRAGSENVFGGMPISENETYLQPNTDEISYILGDTN